MTTYWQTKNQYKANASNMGKMKWMVVIILAAFGHSSVYGQTNSFIHPGILHGKDDLERMRKAVANKEEPIYSGYQVFIQNPASEYKYKMQGPLRMVGRNPTVGQGIYDSDANAAHQNAIMWAITGEDAYAKKAIEIINAWSSTLDSITGRDAVLMAGLGPFKMINAAEIMRYTNAGWGETAISQTEKHFRNVIYPVIKDFAPFANGNWDAAAIKTVMAIGVFCNDRAIFERGLNYYVNGWGNGRLSHYIINEEGQIQESGRDQGHTQLGIAMLAECSEIAWKQGLDLYSYADDRLLKGFEYTAKFNLGNEVPFSQTTDRTGKYIHTQIARQDRGPLRAVYEQLYNHFVNRKGMKAPYIKQAVEKIRPEGPGKPGADHPGYGTLFFAKAESAKQSIPVAQIPAPPAAIIAKNFEKHVQLIWIPSVEAKTYTVKRSHKKGGPYSILAKDISKTNFTDKNVMQGTLYFYTVLATNAVGSSADAYEIAMHAGLPSSWYQRNIGSEMQAGSTSADDQKMRIESYGYNIDSTEEQFYYTYQTLKGNGEITFRYVPQVSSQFSKVGLMVREELTENSPHISLILGSEKSKQIEAPGWNTRLLSRDTKTSITKVKAVSSNLVEPVVTYGRLTGSYWLRLQRDGNDVTGFISPDGNSWTALGTVNTSLKKNLYIGIVACSGIKTVSTTVMVDHVEVNRIK